MLTLAITFLAVGGTFGAMDVLMVTVVHRHGDRSILHPYPTDPFKSEMYWPEGFGQLTNIGKNQLYDLGDWLRQRYSSLLPVTYNEKDIRVQSTDNSRTIMSAQCCLAALYKPKGVDVWRKDVAWQPVPVRTIPSDQDSILLWTKPCPRYDQLFKENLASKEVVGLFQKYSSELANLTRLSGVRCDPDVWWHIQLLYEVFSIETARGFQLPGWTADFWPEPITEIYNYMFLQYGRNEEMRRLRGGETLKQILNNFDKKINGTLTEKMWLYSAHDLSVGNLMQTLGVFNGELPGYASALIFELHYEKETGRYYVSVWYKTISSVVQLKLPGCDAFCPLGTVKALKRPVIPIDRDQECEV